MVNNEINKKFDKLLQGQQIEITQNVRSIWDTFVTNDHHLMSSKCPCCKDKRTLVRKLITLGTFRRASE